jgi:hypothetical protein
LADYIATRPEPSLSLPIRMEQKRKRTRVGAVAMLVGVVLLGGAGYNFSRTGSELIATYLAVLALILLGVGISQVGRASRGG